MKETIKNDAYLHSCECPTCGNKIARNYQEKTFYCSNCGEQLLQPAFSKQEIDSAIFENEMDDYEN